MIEQASGKSTAFQDLVRLGSLGLADQIQQGPDVFRRFFATLDLPVPASEQPVKPVTFDSMIAKWATTTNPSKKGKQDMMTKCNRFAAWLGHRNMAAVTFQNGRDYRDFLIDEGQLAPGSISTHLKYVKALFAYAFDNGHLELPANPMLRVKFSPGDGEEREDFTPDERRRILVAVRQADPVIYWCNWLASFHGTRLSEIADIDARDFVEIEGVWLMQIHRKHRTKDQRLKTKVSIRLVPLHSALLNEGIIPFVKSRGEGPLFREV